MNLIKIIKKKLWIYLFCLSVMIFPVISHSLTIEEVPNPQQQYQGWVSDMANILSDNTEAKLNQMITDLEATNGTEIAVVTVSTTKPAATPKEFTTQLFNHWSIGKKGKDNGVLFLVSQGDRRVEIETGYGIEVILPDAQVSNIINSTIIPNFKLGNFEQGILDGTKALIKSLQYSKPSQINQNQSNKLYLIAIIVLAISGFSYYQATKIHYQKLVKPIYIEPSVYERLDIPSHQKYLHNSGKKSYLCLASFCCVYAISLLILPNLLKHYTNLSTSDLLLLLVVLQFIPYFVQGAIYKISPIFLFLVLLMLEMPIVGILLTILNNQYKPLNFMAIYWASLFIALITSISVFGILGNILNDSNFFFKHFFLLICCGVGFAGISFVILETTLEKQNNLYVYTLIALLLLPKIIKTLLINFHEFFKQLKSIIKVSSTIVVGLFISFLIVTKFVQAQGIIPPNSIPNILNLNNWISFTKNFMSGLNQLNMSLLEDIPADKLVTISTILLIILGTTPIYDIFSRYLLKEKPKLVERPNYHCNNCKQAMELIDNNDLLSLLSRPQQISQELKLAEFEGWKCDNYSEKYQDKTHKLSINLRRYLQKYNISDLNCSHCQEYTLEKTSHVIKSPTYSSTGTREITYNCRYCHHSH